MARAPWCSDDVYAEAARFRDTCLVEDGSLITPGLRVWTPDRAEAMETLITRVDSGTFIKNLVNQVAGHPDEEKQLAAEALYVAFLFDRTTSGAKLQGQVEQVLSTMGASVALPDRMLTTLGAGGVANLAAGMAYRWAHVDGVLQLARQLKPLSESERERLFADPWRVREAVSQAFGNKAEIAGRCLLHLWYPDTFDHVVSSSQRKRFVARFAMVAGVAQETDQDLQIQGIRRLLQAGDPEPINLFDPPLRGAWEHESQPWDAAVGFTHKLFGNTEWETEELEYKPDVGGQLAIAREAVLDGAENWVAVLSAAVRYKRNNLTEQRFASPKFLRWVEAHPDDALAAFRSLWAEGDVETRIAAFLDQVPREAVSGTGSRLSFATFFLLGQDSIGVPFFKPRAASSFENRVREGLPIVSDDEEHEPEAADLADADEVGLYRSWCALIDEFRWRILAATGAKPDRLHAQSAAWTLTNWKLEDLPSNWTEQDKTALLAWRQGTTPVSVNEEPDEDGDDMPSASAGLPPITKDLDALTHLTQPWLEEVWSLLEEKRQLILYGPPGTGKTFLATELGKHVETAGGEYRLVQFHPSYTYEDFFEGYRPLAESGGLKFDLVPGTLKELAESAHRYPDKPHLLVIDEINRGNLPKIFGELYFLLEYRDEAVRLQYSRQEFSLPPNLYVIGTMNTADKSIALVDAALRRRFYFAGMLPTEEPVKGVLPRWLEAQGRNDDAADLLNELNARIADADFSIGPSYLMTDAGNLDRVWTYSILPLLEEHFYSRQIDVPSEFGLTAIRKGLEDAIQ